MLRLFNKRAEPEKLAAHALFRALAGQARRAEFHTRFKVPDTIDGRFDLLTLHAFLVFEGLKGVGREGDRIGTHLATAIFESLDEALRELGVGDTGMSRRIKAMADAFYGRLAAYAAAGGQAEMAEALRRNLYRGMDERAGDAERLASYVLASLDILRAGAPENALLSGAIAFAPLPD